MKSLFYLFLFTLILTPLFSSPLYAQIGTDTSSLTLKVSPERPRANQKVTITLESYAVDLNTSSIVWYVNEQIAVPDSSKKVLTLDSGNYGQEKRVRVVVVSSGGKTYDRNIVIAPAEINIMWQANTYTPPFYKGKALYSNNSDITFIAVPSSNSYKAQDLVYTWRKNGVNIPNSGGLGGNTVTISNKDYLAGSLIIAVEANSTDYKYMAFDFITLEPVFPKVLLYEKNPTQGIRFEKAIQNNTSIYSSEAFLEVYPYYFSIVNRLFEGVNINWRINNQTISEAKNKTSVIIKKGGSGVIPIQLRLDHKDKTLQSTSGQFGISFKEI